MLCRSVPPETRFDFSQNHERNPNLLRKCEVVGEIRVASKQIDNPVDLGRDTSYRVLDVCLPSHAY